MALSFPFIGRISIIPRKTRKLNLAGEVGRSEIRGWAANGSSVEIERTGRTCAGSFQDVDVNRGGGDVGVAEKALNRSDVGPVHGANPRQLTLIMGDWKKCWLLSGVFVNQVIASELTCLSLCLRLAE